MSDSTIYEVRTIYDVTDRASAQLGSIARHAEEAAKATQTLKGLLVGAGTAIAAHGLFHEAKSALIDFNRDVQNAKISLAAMVQGNYLATWDQAKDKASALYAEFQKFSVMTPVKTQELLEFSRGIAVAVAQTGGAIKDIQNVTEQGVIAAKALGAGSQYASMEIAHMLAGNINRRMMFAQQLLGMMGMDEKSFKKLDAGDRLKKVEQVLNSPAMKNAASEFQNSFSGVTSTFEDKMQILGGKLGEPLFKAITKEIASWNDWLTKNQYTVEKMAHTLGEKLVDGFNMIKSAVSFIVDHASTMIKIGEVWAAVKIGQALGNSVRGGVGSMVGGGGGFMSFFRGARDGYDANGGYQYTGAGRGMQAVSMKNIGGNLPLLGQSLMLGVAVGHLLNSVGDMDHAFSRSAEVHGETLDMADKTTAKYADLVNQMDVFDEAIGKATAKLNDLAGGAGTQTSANMVGYGDALQRQANVIGDYIFGRMGDMGGAGAMMNFAKQAKAAGLSDEQISAVMGGKGDAIYGKIGADASAVKQRDDAAIKSVDSTNGLTDEMRKNRELMAILMKMELAKMGDYKNGQYSQGVALSGDDLKAAQAELAAGDLKNKAHVQQTVNVYINQVSARDPDRWIADVDDMAAKRRRVPRRAKSALAGGF